MQPRPIADTSKALFPSFRFLMQFCLIQLLQISRSTARKMSSPPFARRSSFPHLKGTKERIGVLKAQQEGGFVQFHGALFQIMAGKFAAGIFNELLESEARVSKSALKRSEAKAKFLSNILQRGPLAGQGLPECILHLFAHILARLPGFKFGVQLCCDHR